MCSTFNFSPLLCFVCRFCRHVFPDTEKLNEHKLEQHLGDCLGIKCIIFEEQCVDDDDWLPTDICESLGKPKKTQDFLNPYVSLTRFKSEEVGAYSNHHNTNNNEYKSVSNAKRKKRKKPITIIKTESEYASSAQDQDTDENFSEMEMEGTIGGMIKAENDEIINIQEFYAPSEQVHKLLDKSKPFNSSKAATNSTNSSDLQQNDNGDSDHCQDDDVTVKLLTSSNDISTVTQHHHEICPSKQILPLSSTLKIPTTSIAELLKYDPRQCRICNKKFRSTRSCVRHKVEKHGDSRSPKFPCQYPGCGKSFGRKERLDRHMRTHARNKNNTK